MAGLARESYVVTQFMDLMQSWVDELEGIDERLEELQDGCVEFGIIAVEHKLQEARGPLQAALEAARQYRDGRLEPEDA